MKTNIAVASAALAVGFVFYAALPHSLIKALIGLAAVTAVALLGAGYYRHYSSQQTVAAEKAADQ